MPGQIEKAAEAAASANVPAQVSPKQRLVTMQCVQAFEPALQVVAELVGCELHRGSLAATSTLG